MATVKKRRLLVDVSGIAHAAAHTMGQLMNPRTGEKTGVVYGVLRALERLADTLAPQELILCFDNGRRARTEMFPAYKGDRKRDEEFVADFKRQMTQLDKVLAHLPVLRISQIGVEADDVIARIAEFCKHERVGIVTRDKDLYQLAKPPGCIIVTPKTGQPAKLKMRPMQYLIYSILVGGKNNIPGVAGVGDKTARALIKEHGTMKRIVEHGIDVGKLGRMPMDEAHEIISRNWALMRVGAVLNAEERSAIAKAYARGRLDLRIDKVGFRACMKELGFTSILKRLSGYLAPFQSLVRERRTADAEQAEAVRSKNPPSAMDAQDTQSRAYTRRIRKTQGAATTKDVSRQLDRSAQRPLGHAAKAARAAVLGDTARAVSREVERRQSNARGVQARQDAPAFTRRVRRCHPLHNVVARPRARRIRKVVASDDDLDGGVFRSNEERRAAKQRWQDALILVHTFTADASMDAWEWLRRQPTKDLQRLKLIADKLSLEHEPNAQDLAFLQRLNFEYTMELPQWALTDDEVADG